jgi:hypothetical protein
MEKDIVPELLALIESEFDRNVLDSDIIKQAAKRLGEKQATYKDANEFAIEVGEILSQVFKEHITVDMLPEGKMYYNIANRILNPTMSKNHELISGYAADVQTELNRNAGLRIKGLKPELNQDRIDGIINRISDEDDFEKIKWILDEPVKNFSQSIIDDTIRKNIQFHARAGLKPQIIRRQAGNCCDWCAEIVGTYEYPDVPEDVYRRHRFCRCTVEYDPGDGKRQNVHTKEWIDPEKDAKIEARKKIGLPQDDIQLPRSVGAKARDILVKYDIPVRGEAVIKDGSVIKQVNVIAGKGVKRQIEDINRLVKENPGTKPTDWKKMTGIAEMSNGKKAEVHWYQAPNVGKIEFKVKRWV